MKSKLNKCYKISETSLVHNGPVKIAKKLIDFATEFDKNEI